MVFRFFFPHASVFLLFLFFPRRYVLLCGFPPFYAETDAELYQLIKHAAFAFPSPYWDKISTEAKDLIAGLLRKEPSERLTPAQALAHPFLAPDDHLYGLSHTHIYTHTHLHTHTHTHTHTHIYTHTHTHLHTHTHTLIYIYI